MNYICFISSMRRSGEMIGKVGATNQQNFRLPAAFSHT